MILLVDFEGSPFIRRLQMDRQIWNSKYSPIYADQSLFNFVVFVVVVVGTTKDPSGNTQITIEPSLGVVVVDIIIVVVANDDDDALEYSHVTQK
jgi:hypothetical protein